MLKLVSLHPLASKLSCLLLPNVPYPPTQTKPLGILSLNLFQHFPSSQTLYSYKFNFITYGTCYSWCNWRNFNDLNKPICPLNPEWPELVWTQDIFSVSSYFIHTICWISDPGFGVVWASNDNFVNSWLLQTQTLSKISSWLFYYFKTLYLDSIFF